jgi:predicted phage terminase large subunit-like protein
MLSEELIQARDKFILHLKVNPHMSVDEKILCWNNLRGIYKKDEDINHELWANYELRKMLREKLRNKCTPSESKKLQKEYWETFLLGARYSFHDYMLYLEHRRDPDKKFYENRLTQLKPIVQDLQDLYDGKLQRLGISLPPGVGKTTLIIFFLTWVMGKDPLMPNLYSGYADKLCRGTFDGILSIMKDPEYCYKEIFPDSPIATTNAKDESIDLVKQQRFKTFTARSLDSGLTGATRCENILVLDDAVSGIEEAMNLERLDSLWMKVTNDLFSRAKESCRILLVGTRWSCHDVLGRMEERYSEDRKSKFIRISALDEDGNSNFDYKHGVGFSRAYFENMRENMDDVSWRAIYQQEPIEREGLLYQKDQLQHFFELPEAAPDAIVAICDSKNQGKDYVCALCGYVYGDSVYIPSLVFNNGLPEVTKPLVAQMCVDNKVSRIDIESNNGGEYYAQSVDEQIHKLGGFSSVRTFFTSTNKITKIITESDFVKKHFVFLDESKYPPDEAGHEYKRFMQNVLGFTITGKVKHDDGPDGLAMLSQLVKDLSGMEVRIVDRRSLPL